MTQAKSPGSGSYYLADATQIPTAISYPAVERLRNRVGDQSVSYVRAVQSSADFVWDIIAEDNGRIRGLLYANGSQAIDGSNGWELSFVNLSNSSDVLAYFGLGSGTEAAKATDKVSAVSANATTQINNSDTSRFNKGDHIQVTADRDGTAVVGDFTLIIDYGATGR